MSITDSIWHEERQRATPTGMEDILERVVLVMRMGSELLCHPVALK